MEKISPETSFNTFRYNAEAAERWPHKVCLNCGALLAGKFCSQCGQKDLPRRQTLRELLVNFVGSFTSFESKFFQTIRHLLFNPGFLAAEFNAGRRESYYHPARAYVFMSFIFFLVLSLPDDDDRDNFNYGLSYQKQDASRPEIVSLDSIIEFKSRAEYDSIQQTLPSDKRDNWFERSIKLKTIDLNLRYLKRQDEIWADIKSTAFSNFPKVFFLLLPLFAFFLKLLYIRRGFYYSEHLVFSIHYYNFFYLIGSFGVLLSFIPWFDWVKYAIGIWVVVYLFMGMRRVYKQGRRKTFIKFMLFGFIFSFCVFISLILNFLISIFIV